jgi:phage shock protein PspC (stress-responsive transcriptional regulator)
VRRPEGKVIGGVCTGIAAYLGVDVVAVRIAAVLLAIFTFPLGVIGYLVALIVMPMAPEGEPLPPVTRGPAFDRANAGRWIGVGAIVLGAFVLFRNIFEFRGGLFWGLLLIGIGIAVWSREFTGERPRNGSKPPPSPTGTNPTEPLVPPSVPTQTAPPPIPPAPPPPPIARRAASSAPAPSPRRQEPSVLGRLVVGAAALAVGIAVLLDNLDAVEVRAKGVIAVLLAIVAAGLIAGAWFGRARWLIFPGIVLAIALAGATFVPFRGHGTYGNISWQPTSRSELRSKYENAFGNATLDLTHVNFNSKPRRMTLRVRFGNLEVFVPRDVPVVVTGRVRFGNLEVFGREYSGIDVGDTVRSPGDPDLGRMTLIVDNAFGNTEIKRADRGDFIPDGRHRSEENDAAITDGVVMIGAGAGVRR